MRKNRIEEIRQILYGMNLDNTDEDSLTEALIDLREVLRDIKSTEIEDVLQLLGELQDRLFFIALEELDNSECLLASKKVCEFVESRIGQCSSEDDKLICVGFLSWSPFPKYYHTLVSFITGCNDIDNAIPAAMSLVYYNEDMEDYCGLSVDILMWLLSNTTRIGAESILLERLANFNDSRVRGILEMYCSYGSVEELREHASTLLSHYDEVPWRPWGLPPTILDIGHEYRI